MKITPSKKSVASVINRPASPHLRTSALILAILFCLCRWTFASTPAASWAGVLRDNAGTPIVGVTVVLADVAGKTAYTAKTKVRGEFAFSAITPAKYGVSVVTEGITYKSAQPLVVAEGVTLTTTLQLPKSDTTLVLVQEQNGPVSEGSGGEHLSRKEVSSLPLNSRDFSKLLLLAAGTMTDANGAANFTQQFAVNGQRGVTSVFAMDGADTTDPEMGGATFSTFNVDAIQEVQSNSGVMLAGNRSRSRRFHQRCDKSGTNSIHGSAVRVLSQRYARCTQLFRPR